MPNNSPHHHSATKKAYTTLDSLAHSIWAVDELRLVEASNYNRLAFRQCSDGRNDENCYLGVDGNCQNGHNNDDERDSVNSFHRKIPIANMPNEFAHRAAPCCTSNNPQQSMCSLRFSSQLGWFRSTLLNNLRKTLSWFIKTFNISF